MTRRIHGNASAALFITLVLASAPPLTAQCGDCVFPGERWEVVRRADLAEYGWASDVLQQTAAFLRDSANSTGVVVAHKGRVVFTFGDIEELSYLASVRKSILAILYGPWVENGVIDLDATMEDLGVDDVGGLLPIERQATIDHLITARSGVYHPASNSGDNLADAPPRGSREPGTYMLYSNWDFNAAGAVFEQLTGRDIYDEAQAQLAIPLDFEDWDRSVQRKSGNLSISRNPAYHFWLSTRDMARIGHLMLNEGAWNGEQVISREWARRIVSVVTPLEEMNPAGRRDGYFGYGYMWWVFDGPRVSGAFEGAYTGRGAVGQWISVFPALDLVIAHKTKSAYGRTTRWRSWQRLVELLFEAGGVEMGGGYPWEATSPLPDQSPHPDILDTQVVRALAQDVVPPDLVDRDDLGRLDKTEHPAFSIEHRPQRAPILVARTLEFGNPEMAQCIADHRTEGGEGIDQRNVRGHLGHAPPTLLRIPGDQPPKVCILFGPGRRSRLVVAAHDSREGAIAAEAPQLVGLGATDDGQVTPDRGMGRVAEGMPQRNEGEPSARIVVLGVGRRTGMLAERDTRVAVDGPQRVGVFPAPEPHSRIDVEIPREEGSVGQHADQIVGGCHRTDRSH